MDLWKESQVYKPCSTFLHPPKKMQCIPEHYTVQDTTHFTVLLTRKSKVPRKPLLPACSALPLDISLVVLHASRQWSYSGESHCILASAPIHRLLWKKEITLKKTISGSLKLSCVKGSTEVQRLQSKLQMNTKSNWSAVF